MPRREVDGGRVPSPPAFGLRALGGLTTAERLEGAWQRSCVSINEASFSACDRKLRTAASRCTLGAPLGAHWGTGRPFRQRSLHAACVRESTGTAISSQTRSTRPLHLLLLSSPSPWKPIERLRVVDFRKYCRCEHTPSSQSSVLSVLQGQGEGQGPLQDPGLGVGWRLGRGGSR